MKYKLRSFIWKLFRINRIAFGKHVTVYFPNVNKFFNVVVTSISHKTFSGIFVNTNDYYKSRVADDYNQIENDIQFSIDTYKPIKK